MDRTKCREGEEKAGIKWRDVLHKAICCVVCLSEGGGLKFVLHWYEWDDTYSVAMAAPPRDLYV